MAEYYLQIKWLHISAVVVSGCVFLLRAVAVQAGAHWAMVAPLRYLSYAVDTVLLVAAVMLVMILHQYPFADSWLTVKVCLLVVYVGLGTFALKRGRTQRARLVCFVAAMAVYAFIISVAVTHDPLGVLPVLGRLA